MKNNIDNHRNQLAFFFFKLPICIILSSGDEDFEDEGWEEDFDDEDDYYDWHGETGDFTKKYNAATANAQQVNKIFNQRSLYNILTSPNQKCHELHLCILCYFFCVKWGVPNTNHLDNLQKKSYERFSNRAVLDKAPITVFDVVRNELFPMCMYRNRTPKTYIYSRI